MKTKGELFYTIKLDHTRTNALTPTRREKERERERERERKIELTHKLIIDEVQD